MDIRKNDACIIGNGLSRKQFDLHQIHASLVTYGCNALYRDFAPDYLISVDPYMIDEILHNNGHIHSKLYIQGHSKYDNHKLKDQYKIIHYGYKEGYDSGNSALLVACQNKHDKIYMIGFDYTVDNVYANTRNYNPVTHHSLPPVWQTRLQRILKQYPNVKVIRVNATNVIPNIESDNFTNITVEQFKEILNEL